MTVQTNTNVASGAGNGVTTTFPVGFKFNRPEDLVVTIVDDATEAETPITLYSDYTVAGAGNDNGGSVTLTGGALATGKTLIAKRIIPLLQTTDLRNQGKFFAETHEEAFDRSTMIDQQQQEELDRSLKVNLSGRWNALGRRIINLGAPVLESDATTKQFVEAAVAAGDEATREYADQVAADGDEATRTYADQVAAEGDAETRQYADQVDAASAAKALRATENVSPIPGVSARAGKLLSFDEAGNPVAVAAADQSASALAIDLSDSTDPLKGAGQVGVSVDESAKGSTVADELRRLAIYPEQFDNGTRTVAQSLQLAADRAAATGRPLCIEKTYDVDFPIYVPSGARWFGGGRIRNVFSGTPNINKLAIVPGNYSPSVYGSLSYITCAAVKAGARTVTATTASEAGTFLAGDIVFFRSQEYYEGFGSVVLPLYGSMNRVVSADAGTGAVVLEFPILEDVTNARMAKANIETLDIFGRRNIYCCYGAQIDGVSIESMHGNALERGGFLNCDFRFPEIRSLTGLFTNAVCFSRVNIGSIICDRKPFDLAGCSVGSTIQIGSIAYRKTANSSNEPLFALNENALHNDVHVGAFGAEGFDYASQNLIQIGAATANKLAIGTLAAPNVVGSPVVFDNVLRSVAGETQSATTRNAVTIGSLQGGATLQRFAYWINAGSQNSKNSLTIGVASGAVSASAATIAGDGHAFKGTLAAGAVSISLATNCQVDVVTPGGVTGYSRTAGHNVRLNGADFSVAPTISGAKVYDRGTINGGGGGASYGPDMANGSVHRLSFTSATSFAILNPTNIAAGDRFEVEVKNSNGSTAITPTFGTSYFGGAVTAIAAGNSTLFSFRMTATGRIIRREEAANFTG